MTDIKPWWQSKTLWGAIVTLGSAVIGLAGIDVDGADQESLIELLSALGAAGGGVMALIGRISARSRIG